VERCNYCGADGNGSGMCDMHDRHFNGSTHQERVEEERKKQAEIEAAFKRDVRTHEMAYWGIIPKRYL
jgi:hypothetical protein